ncbi:MAG: DUF4382 domain-containing protein [bacterium]|nr:DUF4382 domain-containing protein [bacterium]
MNKKILAILSATLSLVLMGASCSSQTTTSGNEGTKDGSVVISITDAAANMGNVTAISLTENKIELHNKTEGWVTASDSTNTFKLLELKAENKSALVATVDVAPGTYDQLRMSVVNVKVTTKDGVTAEAKLPSNQLTLKSNVEVHSGATSSVNMDFLADVSLHVTGKGKFIFAPVVKIENRTNATVKVNADNSVSIQNGTVVESATKGMDVDGSMKSDFQFGTDSQLEIDGDGSITTTVKVKVPSPIKTNLKEKVTD